MLVKSPLGETTLLIATDTPVMIAPAMNVRMWEHPATQRNLAVLRGDGLAVVGPNDGDMACGEFGPGRMAEPLAIRGMHYSLELNGEDFLDGVSGQTVVVPAFSDQIIESDGVTSLFGYLRQIQALQQGRLESLSYRVSGRISLQTGFVGLPFDYAGELLELPQGQGGSSSGIRTQTDSSLPR